MVRALGFPYSGAIANHNILGEATIYEIKLTKRKRKSHEFPGLVIGFKDKYPLVCTYDNVIMIKKSSYKNIIKVGSWFC